MRSTSTTRSRSLVNTLPHTLKTREDLLEEDNVDELAEHEPSVEFRRAFFPLVPLAHLHLQFALPPLRPRPALLSTSLALSIKPPPALKTLDDPFLLALPAEHPCEAEVVASAPEREV